jgi:hypothetical protein
MNKKKTVASENKSLRKAIFFIGIVCILIMLSMIARFAYIIKNSQFNGRDRFTVAIIFTPLKASLISFDPFSESVSHILVLGKREGYTPGRIIGVPVDAVINLEKEKEELPNSVPKILSYALMHPGIKTQGITSIDMIRLYLFIKSLPTNGYSEESIAASDSEVKIDKLVQKLLIDSAIVNEQKSIEIVNGTNVDGVGKRMERILRNSGSNVVAVSTTQKTEKRSTIYAYGEDSYTLKKLHRVFKYPIVITQMREIADIKIVIGIDGVRDESF